MFQINAQLTKHITKYGTFLVFFSKNIKYPQLQSILNYLNK